MRPHKAASLLARFGGHSIPAAVAVAGQSRWAEATILDLTEREAWVMVRGSLEPGKVLLCRALLPDREVRMVLARTTETMRFDLVPGSLEGVADLLPLDAAFLETFPCVG